MVDMVLGVLSIVALLAFLALAFRQALPFNARTRERSEINKHSGTIHGAGEGG
ncbi:hypothetical protein [Labrys sp. KNU-23]|uniref:hypothetical protein n=1 Tax=Labrys sp. KNU-23 TaxID=2789216 RepID=UPI00165B2C90|nr:hypothetical protein [Labrys sp. KNU-23]